jgi:hypothetical protein
MSLLYFSLLAVVIALGWWVAHRSARLRREAESREARVLEALFAARRGNEGGAKINLDQVFGGKPAAEPHSADALLRAAGLQADLVDLLAQVTPPASPAPPAAPAPARPAMPGQLSPPEQPAAPVALETPEPAAGVGSARTASAEGDRAAAPVEAGSTSTRREGRDEGQGDALVPVRDLVQVFYEGRGFRARPAEPSALPIELVLAHKSDASRSYAFAPLAVVPTEAEMQAIVDGARRIGQLRVLIAVEAEGPAGLQAALSTQPVRYFDRSLIEAQLARLDSDIIAKVRAAANRRTVHRRRDAQRRATQP